MNIGKYKIDVVQTGTFGLDGGAMFGVVPKSLWEKAIPSDERNRIELGGRSLLLRSESKTILVDTGIGGNWNEKFSDIYKVNPVENYLENTFNVKAEEVTDVILTHLHFDHTGGSVIYENEKPLPAFPNAKYHIQKSQFEWGLNPSSKDKGSFEQERFEPLAKLGMVNLVEGTQFFDDEIELVSLDGHTFGQQFVKVSDGSTTIFHAADLFPTPAHFAMPYLMSFDLQPIVTLKDKRVILERALEENWLIVFEHDIPNTAATLKMTDKGITADKLLETLPNE